VPYLNEKGDVEIPPSDCVACGICVSECPARAIFLRKPSDRRQIETELYELKNSIPQKGWPLIVGFCCQYGLFGTGSLSSFYRHPKTGIHIIPVLCIGKIEVEHMIRPFELNAQGVFIAGCGEKQCARDNTEIFARRKAEKAKEIISYLGFEKERIEVFSSTEKDMERRLDQFIEKISEMMLSRTLKEGR
jgi:coenzyme F420-reducing hydrogenase delta subunit